MQGTVYTRMTPGALNASVHQAGITGSGLKSLSCHVKITSRGSVTRRGFLSIDPGLIKIVDIFDSVGALQQRGGKCNRGVKKKVGY